ncbi:SULT6B1 [Mytilus coruscus]|uniref:SULT6B1 n=1 Tax=Mytilus coruscus TaxID=42192 RepID=A0A6J8AS34_MYTCO|nr:SULT6B1 [Mytilus coruscus]
MSRLKVFPLVKYKDFTLVPWPCNEENPGKHLQLLKEFDSRSSDIMLCTSPKSGTHWLHEIIYMLSRQTTEYCPQSLFSTHMDMMADFDSLESQSELRILHTHLPFSFLPTKHVENGRKIVFVSRNPKDRHVSLYNYLLGKIGVPVDYSWSDYFVEMVLHGKEYVYRFMKGINARTLTNTANRKYICNLSSCFYWICKQDFMTRNKYLEANTKIVYYKISENKKQENLSHYNGLYTDTNKI